MGGICICNISKVLLNGNKVENCKSEIYQGGGFYLWLMKIDAILINTKFYNCICYKDGGGCHHCNYNLSFNTEMEKKLSNLVFINCTSTNANSGGMQATTIPVQFKMQNTIFISCSANSRGRGSLYFYI